MRAWQIVILWYRAVMRHVLLRGDAPGGGSVGGAQPMCAVAGSWAEEMLQSRPGARCCLRAAVFQLVQVIQRCRGGLCRCAWLRARAQHTVRCAGGMLPLQAALILSWILLHDDCSVLPWRVAAASAGGLAPAVCSLGLPWCTWRHVISDSCGWQLTGNLVEMTACEVSTAGMRAWPWLRSVHRAVQRTSQLLCCGLLK